MTNSDRTLNLRSLEILAAVVETGGMTLAAGRLGLTQSAVSQAIKNLEDTLQVSLFDRSVRPPALTLLGNIVAKHASEVDEKVRALEQAIRFGTDQRIPVLRIGMLDSVIKTIGPHLLRKMRGAADRWVVMSGANDTKIEAILSRRLDFVVTTLESGGHPDLFEIEILREPCFIMVPASYKGDTTIEAISASLDLIRFGPNLHVTAPIEKYLNDHGVVPPPVYEFNSIDAAVSMVEEGIGWTIVFPLGIMNSVAMLPPSRVRCLPMKGRPLERTIRLIGHRSNGIEIGRRIVAASQETLRENLIPRLTNIQHWLADSLEII